MPDKPKIGVSIDNDMTFYSTPEDLRAAADLLESGDTAILVFDLVIGTKWEGAELIHPGTWNEFVEDLSDDPGKEEDGED